MEDRKWAWDGAHVISRAEGAQVRCLLERVTGRGGRCECCAGEMGKSLIEKGITG